MNDLVRDKLMTESGDITMGAEILAGATVSVSFEIAIYILALLIVSSSSLLIGWCIAGHVHKST